MKKNFETNFFQSLLSMVLGIILYFIFYLPLELLLTEFFFIVPKINPLINTFVLLFFLLITNLFNWKKIINNRKKLVILSGLITIAFIFYGIFHQIKLDREYLPKIYKINHDWIIQGQTVEITGTNFGQTFRKGKIIVDEMEFLVKDWSEDKIIAEAPVPSKEGNFYLYIETKDGGKSNLLPLEVKDPDYLKKYLK
jgi:uncharacterized membrane protein